MSMAPRVILSNFFAELTVFNTTHKQYLSGLARALFPTTFLEIAVYIRPSAFTLVVVQLVKKLASAINFLFVRFLVPICLLKKLCTNIVCNSLDLLSLEN